MSALKNIKILIHTHYQEIWNEDCQITGLTGERFVQLRVDTEDYQGRRIWAICPLIVPFNSDKSLVFKNIFQAYDEVMKELKRKARFNEKRLD